ncbi:MAG: phospholipase D-like domain-containing protein [Acidimicrobiales bacterium]
MGDPSCAFGPFVTGTAILPAMLALIAHATGRCTVVANYLSDYSIQDALVPAERRGVAVTVVLHRTGYGEAAAWLRRGGVHVEVAAAEPYLHAKVRACGGKAMIGSADFSYDAMAVNHELDVVHGGGAAAAVGAFATGVARADA